MPKAAVRESPRLAAKRKATASKPAPPAGKRPAATKKRPPGSAYYHHKGAAGRTQKTERDKERIATALMTSFDTTRFISCVERLTRAHNGERPAVAVTETGKHALADLVEAFIREWIARSTALLDPELTSGVKLLRRHVAVGLVGMFRSAERAGALNAQATEYLKRAQK